MKLKSQTIDLGLSGYDELFMTEQERADTRKPKVEEIPLTETGKPARAKAESIANLL